MIPELKKLNENRFVKKVEDPEENQGNVPFKKMIARAAQEKLMSQSSFFSQKKTV